MSPTVEPSESSPSPPTPGPSIAVIEDFGADELLFTDDFSDPASGFGVGTTGGGTVAYVNGALQFDTAAQGAWMWSRRTHSVARPVLHVEAAMTPSANGYVGLLCANNDDELWGAVANSEGLWAFVSLDSEGVSVLTSNQEAGWEIAPGTSTRMALDCAGAETGAFRMQLSLPDIGLAATYEAADGADSFDRAGVYGESSAHPFSLRVDDVSAYGGEGLLGHVPVDWRESCLSASPSANESGARSAVSCQLSTGRSEAADFVQFDTQQSMDAAYQTRVDTWAVEPTDSCETGPNEASYTIDGSPAGRILCAPQTVGIRFDWTHDALIILSTLTNSAGSYAEAYQDWLIAGPE